MTEELQANGAERVPDSPQIPAEDAAENSLTAQAQKEAVPDGDEGEWYAQDSRRFAETYPDLDREALFADGAFLDYAEGKVGKQPLSQIYEGYMRWRTNLAAPTRAQAARAASYGSLQEHAAPAEAEFYTLEEMKAMSSAYIEQHWDKVQKSLSRLK